MSAMLARPLLCKRFIGRVDELAFLGARRLEAGRSRGCLVVIAGEAGIGKSRLLSEFCRGLAYSRFRIGRGACLENAQRPYAPVLQALADIDGVEGAMVPQSDLREQLDAIVSRFTRISAKNAILVIVEDVHWADAATLDLLSFIAPKLEQSRILILATMRPQEISIDHPLSAGLTRLLRAARGGVVDLAPFAEDELRLLLAAALDGETASEDMMRDIVRLSDGNPFYAEELLQAAMWGGRLPTSIAASVAQRWSDLSDNDRRVVSRAAVIGRSFDIRLLARTLDLAEKDVTSPLGRARDRGLLIETSATVFRFRHALTREAIYGRFLRAEVVPAHRAIALILEDMPAEMRSTEDLAYHWAHAGDVMRSATYNERAGDDAARIHAHGDALAFYRLALASNTHDHFGRGVLMEKMAERFYALNLVERRQGAYEDAACAFELAGDLEREARCRVVAALAAYTLSLPDPTANLRSMIARLDPVEYLARARLHLGLAWLAASYWYPTDAARDLALVDARALQERPDLRLRYHNVAAWIAMTVGDPETFGREHAAWLEAASGGPAGALAAAHTNGAFCYALFGRHDEASRNIDLAIALSQRDGSRHGLENAYATAAACRYLRGDLHGVRTALRHVPAATTNQVVIGYASGWGTLAGLRLGDDALVRRWYDEVGSTIGTPLSFCGAGFAEVLAMRGRPNEAAGVLHRTLDPVERRRGNVLTLLAAARYAESEDVVVARKQLVANCDTASEQLEHYALSLFDAFVAVRESRSRDAAELARSAAEGFDRLGFPLFEALAHEIAGDVPSAIALYRACGAAADVGRLERSTGFPSRDEPSGSEPRSGRSSFSARESSVASLAAGGSSNKEIAQRLDISVKTVEKHLASVYRKLGVNTEKRRAHALKSASPQAPARKPET